MRDLTVKINGIVTVLADIYVNRIDLIELANKQQSLVCIKYAYFVLVKSIQFYSIVLLI